ncbi:hypothetical protein pEaSNUABM17_00041 [Erwinia phage pEa_SNUABM_17]|uniref:Uncharacterized protein n=1 Tax=Erwinia phage pEa_SNUABM_17 TaxID=2869545 RepID=A0AAE7XLN2_9CAUD|nr:hypothetical protein MPK72_gp041 [Erwinia phage pEa_SNUABM_17]QZE57587.1 hypothetical protein pEaSNUABM17_00041 [Erwinia phage pEa_SNUABM_17]
MTQQALVFKYVMFVRTRNKERTDGVHMPVIFPSHIMHSDMDEAMIGYAVYNGHVENHYYQQMKAVSAGFIDLRTLQCFGESESLELKSRPEDSAIIAEYMKTQGKGAEAPPEVDE